MPVKQGVDTEEFGEFVEWLGDNPEDAEIGVTASARYGGTVGRSTGSVDSITLGGDEIEHDIPDYDYGSWAAVEDVVGYENPEDKIEPVETALSSLAACLNVAVSANALAEGIELDDLETTVNTAVDPSVLFGVQDVEDAEACLKGVEAKIEVDGEDLTEEDLEKIREMSRRSPVHTLVSSENAIFTTVEQAD